MTTASLKTEKLTLTKANGIAEIHLHVNKTNSYNLDFYRELNAALMIFVLTRILKLLF